MTIDTVITALGEIIGVPESDLSGDTPLTPEYDITSLDVARLMIEIERIFDITVHDEVVHTFGTAGDVARYVDSLI
ncbi:MAG: acyl carrier protein [Oscillospiraceae bacterium]|jgi:acyl carrier protein|nr:acyl carrier protein [Oscillospiraceae bacterium]